MFIKYNKFTILLESSEKSELNLIKKKDLLLSNFLNPDIIRKIIRRVSKKVSRTTDNPHIPILLQNKIGNDFEVIELICKWQNMKIDEKRDLIINDTGTSYYSDEALKNKGKPVIETAFKKYSEIVSKIKKKSSKNLDHKEYMSRLENMNSIVEIINLSFEENYDKAYSLMKRSNFLPLQGSTEPDINSLSPEILHALPEVILLSLSNLETRLRQNSDKYSASFGTPEGRESKRLKDQITDLKTYFLKIQKIFISSMRESSVENTERIKYLNSVSEKIHSY
mmetsp:Transcript_19718/g.17427  ORF Transcript_19718/g.17427 Transcript_19718/m.17427 type:complete len:281 (-) Transcript_19718:22-864(-)